MNNTAHLTVQRWGNSLAVRIPAKVARSTHFMVGTPVEITVEKIGISIKSTGNQQLTLAERLALFDPKQHSGEIIATQLAGNEIF